MTILGDSLLPVAIDPHRFREQLIRGLSEDGLEELTLRLVVKDHPNAHRTGRGTDGGIDVLSDHNRPPARAWQCKTSDSGMAKWDKCRASIKSAMDGNAFPRHYTFVFDHPLSANQRDFWRDTLLLELQSAYPDLVDIDYWDNLAWRIEAHADIVDWLTDGALGTYVRTVMGLGGPDIALPSNSVDAGEALSSVAQRSKAAGRDDPHFAYGETGREAHAGDSALPDRRAHFSMSAGQKDSLPTFKLTLRDGDHVTELSAQPRDGVLVEAPEPWFSNDADGQRARAHARTSLARGVPIKLKGPHVGIKGGDFPKRFASWHDPDHASSTGELELGISEPLTLTVTLDLPNVGAVPETIQMYRVPGEPGTQTAYAGSVGGAVFSIDVFPTTREPGKSGPWVECTFGITLAVNEQSAHDALRGLGFSRAFGDSEHIHLDCPGLLPKGGYNIYGRWPMDAHAEETWEVAATVALALDGLQLRDGIKRVMPAIVNERDVAVADIVLHLLDRAEVSLAIGAGEEFPAPLPPHAKVNDDPEQWLIFTAELPPFVGQPTGLIVEQTIEGASPLRIEPNGRGALTLVCKASEHGASVVSRAVNHSGTETHPSTPSDGLE